MKIVKHTSIESDGECATSKRTCKARFSTDSTSYFSRQFLINQVGCLLKRRVQCCFTEHAPSSFRSHCTNRHGFFNHSRNTATRQKWREENKTIKKLNHDFTYSTLISDTQRWCTEIFHIIYTTDQANMTRESFFFFLTSHTQTVWWRIVGGRIWSASVCLS